MTTRPRFMVVAAALALIPTATAGAGTAAELKEQVRKAESGFARSMADRDHAAFSAHVEDDAVFLDRTSVRRGKAAVVEAWKPHFEGAQAPFSWEPAEVEVLDNGTLALTSGPVYGPSGKRIGTFNSVWRRERDGSWKVVFDKGCPSCDCGSSSVPASAPPPKE